MNPQRTQREIGRELEDTTCQAKDVERIVEHVRWCSLEADRQRATLAHSEEIAALLAGAAALMRETAGKMGSLSDELIGQANAPQA